MSNSVKNNNTNIWCKYKKNVDKLDYFTLKIPESVIKLSHIFLAKQEISETYTNVPAKTHLIYFISMSEFCLSVALFCARFMREL